MALRFSYIAKETGQNLRRNVTLTVAAVLTVAVSLSLVGTALLVRAGVDNAFQRWEGGIEFIVFMDPNAEQAQIDSVRDDLEANQNVSDLEYLDKDESYEEFLRLFEEEPDLTESIEPADLPTSFRVTPVNPDATEVQRLGETFGAKAGVEEVVFARDAIDQVQRLSGWLSTGVVVTAFALLVASALLILNTIRMAMFARRREIEVMKLVGATNLFIRIPFVVEGLIHGVVGAGLGSAGLYAVHRVFERASENESLKLLSDFVVSGGQLRSIQILIFAVGCGVGALGSGIAAGRFLDV